MYYKFYKIYRIVIKRCASRCEKNFYQENGNAQVCSP